MAVFAIADLHLSFGVANKKMDRFGEKWIDHPEKIAKAWKEKVAPDDLVLVAGDISWAMNLKEVERDLAWIDALPGKKVLLRGNHDYWWASLTKLRKIMPASIELIHHSSLSFGDISICGTRLWDSEEYHFSDYIDFQGEQISKEKSLDAKEKEQKIFARELERLKLALSSLDASAKTKIVMTHYPPISADLKPSLSSKLFEEHGVDLVLFGHLHALKASEELFGSARGIDYHLTSADYLHFSPKYLLP